MSNTNFRFFSIFYDDGERMNTIERIRMICKERKIPISRLEKDLGFSNAYIRGLSEGKIPADRLYKIANYLDLSPEFLLTGEYNGAESASGKKYYFDDETAEKAQEIFENHDMRVLFDAARDSRPEHLQIAADLLTRLKETNPDG